MKLALWFSIQGDLRFLSHRDTMRLWQRVISRTRLPVKFSQGFNPHMKLSLPLPRSVGMAAQCELLLVDLETPIELDTLSQIVPPQLPDGMRYIQAASVPMKVSSLPQWARYHFILAESTPTEPIQQIIDAFHQSTTCPVQRSARGRHLERTLELKDHITHMTLQDNIIECQVNINTTATPRIDEILQKLTLTTPRPIAGVERVAVKYHKITLPG